MLIISDGLILTSPYQFTINNPLIGYNNLVTPTNIVASSADASGFFPITNAANPATYTKWKASSTAAQTLTISPGSSTSYVGIARHNLGTIGATIKVEGTLDGSTYTTLISQRLVTDNTPLLMYFTLANYVALRITIGSGSAVAQIAVVYAGVILTLQRRIYVGHTPITMGRNRVMMSPMSESGEFLGRIQVSEGRMSSVSMKNLTPDWYRQFFDPFVSAVGETPFFFAWRPETYPLEVGYCWITGEPKPTNAAANGLMSCDFSIGGIS